MPKVNAFCKAALKLAVYYWPVAILLLVGIVSLGIYLFGWEWTGFLRYEAVSTTREIPGSNPPTSVTADVIAGKTLWDLAELLLIPAVLAGGAFWLNRREREAERKLADRRAEAERAAAEERRREDTLQDYLDTMTGLILDRGLRESQPGDAVRDIARARTLSVLRVLDSARNRTVVQFLREAELFEPGEETIVNLAESTLEGAELERINFEKADLRGARLSGANLIWASLTRADLSGADLSEADLSGAKLIEANLSGANLIEANLSGTVLIEANLSRADLMSTALIGVALSGVALSGARLSEAKLGLADLNGANLIEANLIGANLIGTNLIEANLSGAYLTDAVLDEAILADVKYTTATRWPTGFDPAAAGAILVEK